MSPSVSRTKKEHSSDRTTNDEFEELTEQLNKLQLRRSSIISELKAVDVEHTEIEQKIKRALIVNCSSKKGRDSKGNILLVGDSVTTLTIGRYYERIATITDIRSNNHVDIEYKTSKKQTWRAGHNLLKL